MTDENTSPLEYEDQPVVGNVVCQRAGGLLTIRIRRSTAAVAQALLLGGAGVAFLVVVVVAVFAGGVGSWALWLLLSVGGILVTGATLAAHGLSPVVITLDDNTLALRARGLLEIRTSELRRGSIADVRVDRLPFKDTLLRPHAVVAVMHGGGGELQLAIASRAEARYVADVLRDALRLPHERWPEAGYPPRPWLSRVSRAIHPDGAVLSLHPSLVPAS